MIPHLLWLTPLPILVKYARPLTPSISMFHFNLLQRRTHRAFLMARIPSLRSSGLRVDSPFAFILFPRLRSRVAVWLAIEVVWTLYPPRAWTSLLLLGAHLTIFLGLLLGNWSAVSSTFSSSKKENTKKDSSKKESTPQRRSGRLNAASPAKY